jgi:hypothetical protein
MSAELTIPAAALAATTPATAATALTATAFLTTTTAALPTTALAATTATALAAASTSRFAPFTIGHALDSLRRAAAESDGRNSGMDGRLRWPRPLGVSQPRPNRARKYMSRAGKEGSEIAHISGQRP